MLLNHMGRDACLEGIQKFIAHYSTDPDHPLLEDFVASMRPFAPDAASFDEFVDAWFFDVVVPEYRLSDERLEDDGAGGWTVQVTVENTGTSSMPVEVAAVRAERFDEDGSVAADYRESRTTITLGPEETAQVTFECDFEPDRVLVDPDAVVLQLKRDQAVVRF